MKIVITDVTDMRGGHICVAGWSLDEERMIRPLHGSGHYHWNTNMARDDLLCPGNIITIKPSGQLPVRGNPHAAEDYLIIGEPALSGNLSDVDMVQTATGSVHDSVQSMFGDLFSVEHFVPEDEGFCSLGAIETQSRRMGFDNNYEKLRCWFYDNNNERFSLPVSCRALNGIHNLNGVGNLEDLKLGKRTAHIRLGLANPWGGGPDNNWNPKRCYAMVNGVFFV